LDMSETARLLLGSIHCHSVFSDGHATPRQLLAAAGRAGLDFLAITDHVPPVVDEHGAAEEGSASRGPAAPSFPSAASEFPRLASGVLRIPGLEYSPPGGHYLVLGAEPWEVPDPSTIDGWPAPASTVRAVAGRAGLAGFIAHPDDEGSSFLKVPSYAWKDWDLPEPYGLEVWNLSTDLARSLRSYRDVLRALLSGPYRSVPAPHPATLARWDRLGRYRRTVGIAGTDAHAYPARWHGIPVTVVPYDQAFASLATGIWVSSSRLEGTPEEVAAAIVEALSCGRALVVNRSWGHPLGFVFQARPLRSSGPAFVSGDVIPPGLPVRFEVAVPRPAWIRLLRNGVAVANTYGSELSLEPLPGSERDDEPGGGPGFPGGPRQEAWRVEVWVSTGRWSKACPGFSLWLMSNHIYRALR